MNIEAFLLCDAATDTQGKLNVLGAFDNIFAQQIPVVHPACAVALRIRFARIEEGQHAIRLNVIDQDGKPVVPGLGGNIAVKIAEGLDSAAVNIVINLQQLKLAGFGEYRIDLAVDGRQESSLPFTVRRLPGPPPPAAN